MLRAIYVILLRLHPRFFRQQFAEEMLWIFDESANTRREFSLFADALRSLATQWMFRSDFDQEPQLAGIAAPGADRVPVFYVSGSELPPPGALLNGLVLAVGVFSLAGFALAHSGGGGRIYTYYSNDFHEGPPSTRGDPAPPFWERLSSAVQKKKAAPEPLRLATSGGPQGDQAGKPAAFGQAASAASAPRKTDAAGSSHTVTVKGSDSTIWERFKSLFEKSRKPGDGSGVPNNGKGLPREQLMASLGAPGGPAPNDPNAQGILQSETVLTREQQARLYFGRTPILAALDTDHDGILSRQEIAIAPDVLMALDKNQDGKLDSVECGMRLPVPPTTTHPLTPPGKLPTPGTASQREDPRQKARNEKDAHRARLTFMRVEPVLAALDADHDGSLSMSEIGNAPAALKTLDRNSDGRLTIDEVAAEPVAREVAAIFRLDTDFDNRISRLERINALGRRIQPLLDAADRNRDGYVTWDELAREIRSRADLDHDGVVSWPEMLDARKSGSLFAAPKEPRASRIEGR